MKLVEQKTEPLLRAEIMDRDIESYLKEVHTHLHLDNNTEEKILKEIYSHLEDAIKDNKTDAVTDNGCNNSGSPLCRERAVKKATKSLGDPQDVARLMYSTYSRSNWEEGFLHIQPYLLLFALFFFDLWNSFFPVAVTIIFLSAVCFYGLRRGIGSWMLSWNALLFSGLVTLVFMTRKLIYVIIISLSGLASDYRISFSIFTVALSILTIIGLTISTLVILKFIKYDWLPVSSMFIPLPLLIGRVILLENSMLSDGITNIWQNYETVSFNRVALGLLICGIGSLISVIIGCRRIKVIAVFSGSFISLVLLIMASVGLDLYTVLAVAIASSITILAPLLIHRAFFRENPLDVEILKRMTV